MNIIEILLLTILYFCMGVVIACAVQKIEGNEITEFAFGMCTFFWPIVLAWMLFVGLIVILGIIGQRISRSIRKILKKVLNIHSPSRWR